MSEFVVGWLALVELHVTSLAFPSAAASSSSSSASSRSCRRCSRSQRSTG
jgi:hypothetical protein